ncbi:hypothetical protein RCG19_06125 [Neobacillus sp. OS1-2]|uniref:hypothetical protein n=1 Tax=Neobacillus sp. OS1-2 TaxID=3070680 RepID=UPI0027DF9F52|nr:hypothetical protein [Neobacillus sp. OS1-2]WML41229.1 hypothetical protein RCG19_06125 [Neobacillus sp. OS1-2]
MRKILVIFIACLLAVSLSGCKEEQVDSKTKSVKTTSNSEKKADSKKADSDEKPNKIEPVVNDQEVEQGMNLLDYRPEVGSKKSFTEKGELVFTEEIIAANDEYVQTLLQLGDNKTTQIYRWTKDEITLLYEENNSENANKDILNNFVPIEQYETIVNNDSSKSKTWNRLAEDQKVTVPAGDFSHVLTIQKKTNEVVNEETTYTRYYAPKQGLIKEEFKLSGENGYSATSELEKKE